MTAIADARILFVATNRFEESELFGPREILLGKGAAVTLASLDTDEIMGTVHDEPGRTIMPDITIAAARVDDYDALLLPGGLGNPDRLRSDGDTVALVRGFVAAGKPVAAICHAPWLLVEADVVRGRQVACWHSIRTDLRNAGGIVVDQAAVRDRGIITSRGPDDVAAFTAALMAAVEESG